MNETTRILYITCSNGHRKKKIAKAVPREDFDGIFTEATNTNHQINLHGTYSTADGQRLPFTQKQVTPIISTLIWVNTPETKNLRNPKDMPSGTTDLDRKHIIICPEETCRHSVMVTEGTFRTRIYEPATRQGRIYLDIAELEDMLTI